MFRSQSLDNAIARQLSLTGGRLARAGLVTAMESAATVDLTGAAVLPELLATVNPASQPPAVRAMLTELGAWLTDGAARKKGAPGDAQYRHAGTVAAMDHLEPQLAQTLFGTVLRDLTLPNGGLDLVDGVPYGYSLLPMVFADTPNSRGAHLGSAYDSGYESYVVKALRLTRGAPVAAPFGPALSSRLCGGGLAACGAAVDKALQQTAIDLAAANGGITDPTRWTVRQPRRCRSVPARRRPDDAPVRRHRLPRPRPDRPAEPRLAEPPDLPAGGRVLGIALPGLSGFA